MSTRDERTALVNLLVELQERQKGSKVPAAFTKTIKDTAKKLRQLYKKATVVKWKQDMMIQAQDVVMPTFMTTVNEDAHDIEGTSQVS